MKLSEIKKITQTIDTINKNLAMLDKLADASIKDTKSSVSEVALAKSIKKHVLEVRKCL